MKCNEDHYEDRIAELEEEVALAWKKNGVSTRSWLREKEKRVTAEAKLVQIRVINGLCICEDELGGVPCMACATDMVLDGELIPLAVMDVEARRIGREVDDSRHVYWNYATKTVVSWEELNGVSGIGQKTKTVKVIVLKEVE